jgi:hypothetical protein
MRAIARILVASVALLAVVSAVGMLTTRAARAAHTSDVRVVNTTGESVPVTVASAPSAPVFADTDGAARAGIGAECDIAFYNGETQCTLANVPAGSVLVIDMVTCGASVAGGSAFPGVTLLVPSKAIGGGVYGIYHQLSLAHTGTIGGTDFFGAATPVRIYAAGGYPVNVLANAAAGSHDVLCTIAGHLVGE